MPSKHLELHSTRLFPKNAGAASYEITGIAARCDWVVLTDRCEPKAHILRNVSGSPKTIFLSLRSLHDAISYFYNKVWPLIHSPTILITGSEDITVPRQVDRRWRPFSDEEKEIIQKLLADPKLIHWFAENLDCAVPGMSPIPLGMSPPEKSPTNIDAYRTIPPLNSRPLTVLCAHRVRDDPQWQPRKYVNELCKQEWSGFATLVEREISLEEYRGELIRHTFCLCVEGGGLDPSPKAWDAILHGCIPIVRRTPLASAYSLLPVVFVEDWSAESVTTEKLQAWREEFAREFVEPEKRNEVLRRLSLDFWWDAVLMLPNAT